MNLSDFKALLIGKPLSSSEMTSERIPKWKALAVLSSDALSSVAYATEEILIPLAMLSVLALAYSVPVGLAIVALLIIVSLSYRQTIQAYPNGGGAYVVAKENLGTGPALAAGAALLIGYVLTVSVSIAAGVRAITSAFPELYTFRVWIGLVLIFILTILNLRGIRESASIFALPTYVFIVSFFTMIGLGWLKVWTGDAVSYQGPETPLNPLFHEAYMAVPMFLVLRAFSSGCAALTGIEAISNAVPTFRDPPAKNAKATLSIMAILLSILFIGITGLSHVYGVLPDSGGGHGEAAVSNLARLVFGDGFFYYVIQFSTALILILAANTSYNGFPWLAAILAKDRFLPRQLAILGDKLVYSNSIIWLSVAAAFLIILFDADTHALVPLYAIGVFLGFTLSQSGMVVHHLKKKRPGWMRALPMNLLGAITTLIVMLVVGATKFAEGAWIVVILIPTVMWVFTKIKKHYLDVGEELSLSGQIAPEHLEPMKNTAVVPISGIHRGVVDALRYALSIADDVRACYVEISPEATERMRAQWLEWGHDVPLTVIKSPYRSITRPLLNYIDDLEATTHGEVVTVVIPEFVTRSWWHNFLHNQTAIIIKAALIFKPGKVVTSVKYYLKAG